MAVATVDTAACHTMVVATVDATARGVRLALALFASLARIVIGEPWFGRAACICLVHVSFLYKVITSKLTRTCPYICYAYAAVVDSARYTGMRCQVCTAD